MILSIGACDLPPGSKREYQVVGAWSYFRKIYVKSNIGSHLIVLGRVDFKENIYFRKETIEDNLASGIIDLRYVFGMD